MRRQIKRVLMTRIICIQRGLGEAIGSQPGPSQHKRGKSPATGSVSLKIIRLEPDLSFGRIWRFYGS